MAGKSTMITLNNDVEMPALSLGVFQSAPQETAAAVTAALQDGYRPIDTAAVYGNEAAYGNEKEVGEGIVASAIERGEIPLLVPAAIRATRTHMPIVSLPRAGKATPQGRADSRYATV